MDVEKRTKRRNNIISEIISTEKTYLARLECVIDVYVKPIRISNILEPADIREQFGYWDVMYGIHRELYLSMTSENAKIGPIFFQFSHYLKVYKDYLINFEESQNHRAILMQQNKRFHDLVINGQKDPRTFGLSIESLLIEPVQRIPRYRMLLSELINYTNIDHEEYQDLVKSLEKVSEVATENNEAIKMHENRNKMNEIMLQIDTKGHYLDLLDDPSRRLIRSGQLFRQCTYVDS
jgi:hypothetical protein